MAFADSHGGEGDVAKGEKVFRKCKACHAVGDDAKNRVGPMLNGIVGRQIAEVEEFSYSDALKDMGAEGKVWDAAELAAFLEKPRDYAKGTKMSFAGLRKEDDRADVIAYLATFSE
ncbi:c-type cytochrome [Primorskyibacter sedentarius]